MQDRVGNLAFVPVDEVDGLFRLAVDDDAIEARVREDIAHERECVQKRGIVA